MESSGGCVVADLLVHGSARGPVRLLFLHRPAAAAVASRSTPHGFIRVVVDARDGESADQLGRRACAQLADLALIAETVAQTWPRLDGEVPSPAEQWLARGFDDAEVVAWLEAGVPWATSAAELRAVGITPRDVARELDQGWSIGLIFARGDLTLAEVQRMVVEEMAP